MVEKKNTKPDSNYENRYQQTKELEKLKSKKENQMLENRYHLEKK